MMAWNKDYIYRLPLYTLHFLVKAMHADVLYKTFSIVLVKGSSESCILFSFLPDGSMQIQLNVSNQQGPGVT